MQIHAGAHRVAIFSRRLENITEYYPDIVTLISKSKLKDHILEAEVVAIQESTGEYLPFQELMHRRRKYNIQEDVTNYPISLNLFDILLMEGEDKISLPYATRGQILESIVEKARV